MRPVAAVASLGLMAGCVVGFILPDLPRGGLIAALLLAAGGAVRSNRISRAAPFVFFVSFSFFAGGIALAADAWHRAWQPTLRAHFDELARQHRTAGATRRSPPEDPAVFAVLTGVLRADASARATGVSLSLDVRSLEAFDTRAIDSSGARPVRGGVLLTVGGTMAFDRAGQWRAGRAIRVPVLLRRPSRYLNPGVADEERSLARRGSILVGSVKSGALVTVTAKGRWTSEAAAEIRSVARRAIASSVGRWSSRSAVIVGAILIGDRAGLDDDLERRLQEAGTYHVIAISGGNIAILAALTLFGFRLAGVLGPTAMLTAIAALLAYAYVVGGGASVNRATLMAVVYFAARALDLRGSPINVLALSAGVLTVADPLAIADAGFLLTFGATLAILVGVPAANLDRVPRFLVPIAVIGIASLAVEIVLLPISASIFSRVTIAGLLLNFAAIPLMGIVQLAGIATVLAAPLSPTLSMAAGWSAHVAAEGLLGSSDLVTLVPALTWRVPPPHWAMTVTYYVSLILAWSLRSSRQTIVVNAGEGAGRTTIATAIVPAAMVKAAATLVAGFAGIWIGVAPWRLLDSGSHRLHVTFIDVGQGDAALIRFPRGTSMLVDAGGLSSAASFDVGDRVVAPVLRAAGIRRLDVAAVTHGDQDHAAGLTSIVREFAPREIWEGIKVPRLDLLRDLRAEAWDSGSRWTNVQTGDVAAIDGVEVLVRHPGLPDWERQDVRNDDSIVLELLWREVSVVLTGDIGRDVEQDIAPLFGASLLRVIKVPHHGSLSSSSREFVRALAPRVAVVSAGRSNTFGHPAPEVLETYRQAGAHLFRTDQDGAVTVETDGYSLEVRTFMGQRVTVRP